jgi:hypothetical protein
MSKRKSTPDNLSGFLSGQGKKPAALPTQSDEGEVIMLERNTVGLPAALNLNLKQAELTAGLILNNSRIKKYELIIAAIEHSLAELDENKNESEFIKILTAVIEREYRYPQ